MKILFKTRDGLDCIRECPEIENAVGYCARWLQPPQLKYGEKFNFTTPVVDKCRRYEFTGAHTEEGVPIYFELP